MLEIVVSRAAISVDPDHVRLPGQTTHEFFIARIVKRMQSFTEYYDTNANQFYLGCYKFYGDVLRCSEGYRKIGAALDLREANVLPEIKEPVRREAARDERVNSCGWSIGVSLNRPLPRLRRAPQFYYACIL